MENFADHIAYKQEVYQGALEATDFSQLLIASGSLSYHFRDDLTAPFTTSAYFREWLPLLSHPDSFLQVSRNSGRPTLLLKVVEDFWHSAPEALPAEILSAVDMVEYSTADHLKALLSQRGKTAFIGDQPPAGLPDIDLNPANLLAHIDFHRAWKSPYEMDNMRRANRLAVTGHRAAEKAFRDGCSEREIHSAYLAAVGCLDEELPYPNIVALNEHAAVLHHTKLGGDRPADSRSFLIDAGAAVNGYAADITRTYIREGGDDCFGALIAGTETFQQTIVARLKPGVDYVDLHLEVHQHIAELLSQLNIIRVSAEEAVSSGLTSAFMPHGLGHLIGVQVHDRGGHMAAADGALKNPPEQHPFLRCTRTIEANMAFTIEPGIYFIPVLLQPWRDRGDAVNWAQVEALLPYGGVRIEDDVIVHADRVENMTRDAFAR